MNLFSKFNNKKISKNSGIFLVSSLVTLIIIGINYTGLFQLLELTLFDHFFRFRSSESKEEKIVIVTIDDEDINNVQQWPLSDQLMAKLLRKIISQKPITIGLDIYKDIPVNPGYQDLVNVFESFPNLIGVQKIGKKSVKPSPKLKELQQVGFADLVLDKDGKIRRALLTMKDKNGNIQLGLATYLSLIYLETKNIELKPISVEGKDNLQSKYQLGKVIFSPLKENDGGYINNNIIGYEILLNYRGTESSFTTVSLTDVLNNNIPSDLMTNKVVLIGSTAASLNDNFYPPYGNSLSRSALQTAGVVIHANIVSQLINSALGERKMIKVIPQLLEYVWFLICSFIAFKISFFLLDKKNIKSNFSLSTQIDFLVLLILEISIFLISYIIFLMGWWLPVMPSMVSVGMAFLICPAYKNYHWQHLANVDKLTQVANRGYFDLYLDELLQEKLNSNDYLSLILCDIDFFKQYNDTYGHQEGDVCLQKVAEAIAKTVRKSDLVARYGGEEFVIVLPNTDAKTGMKVAERIRKNVEKLDIIHEKSQVNNHVTLSCGVGVSPFNTLKDDLSSEYIIKKADLALYLAKGKFMEDEILSKNPISVFYMDKNNSSCDQTLSEEIIKNLDLNQYLAQIEVHLDLNSKRNRVLGFV